MIAEPRRQFFPEVSLQGESKSLSSSLLGIMFSDTSLDFSSIWESDGLLSGRAAARFGDAFDDKVRELNNLHEVCLRNRTTAAQSERERQIKIWSNKYRAGTLGEGYGSTSSEVIRYEQKEQERKRELLSSLKDAAAEARARKKKARADEVADDKTRMETHGTFFVPEIPSELREKAERWLYEKYGKKVSELVSAEKMINWKATHQLSLRRREFLLKELFEKGEDYVCEGNENYWWPQRVFRKY